MELILVDINENLCKSWESEFKDYKNITVINGSIFDQKADAVISPANSFGNMDGGIDGKLRDFFGVQIEEKVRNEINNNYFGELPVGNAISVETENDRFKFLITAPTMRVPEDVSNTMNAYLAMRAILIEAIKKNMKSIAIPGLAALSGKMKPEVVARQMRVAFDKIVLMSINYSHWREEKAMQDYMQCRTQFLPEDLSKNSY